MRFSKSKFMVAVVLFCMSCPRITFSQSFTEEPLPHPLPKALTADLFKGATSTVHVIGVADSITEIFFDDIYGVQIPYYVRRDDSSFTLPIALPDTGWYFYAPFQGRFHQFLMDAAVTEGDSIFIVWGKEEIYATDVPPIIGYRPRVRCILKTLTDIQNIFDLESANNPKSAISQDGFAHWVWESVAPISPDTNYFYYRSIVQYRYRTSLGVLSFPQDIDTGFIPQIFADDKNIVHILWLKADSSTSQNFELRYCSITSGAISPPITLRENMRAYENGLGTMLPRIAFSVDSSGKVYAGWAEKRAYPDNKYFLLTWNGISITLDSSEAYSSQFCEFAFHPNGEVFAAWGFDQLINSSNVNTPLFSHVSVFQSALNAGAVHLQLTRTGTPKALYGDWSSNSINYIRDLNGPDSVFSGPSPGFFLTTWYTVAKPMLVDDQNRTWVAYAKGRWDNYSLWLAMFPDDPNSVDEWNTSPQGFALFQNYPNPFNPSTIIRYELPKASHVTLKVLNVLGQEVAVLVDEEKPVGRYQARFNASSLPSGVYFYRLQTERFVETRKLMLLK